MKNLLLLLLLTLSLNAISQDLKLEKGAEFGYNNTIVDRGTIPDHQEYTFHFKVLGKDASENYKLSCTLVRMKRSLELGKGFVDEFNSDEIHKTSLNSTYPLLPLAILQQPFFVILSPKGKFLRLEGIDTLIGKAVSKWELGKERENELRANSRIFPVAVVERLFLPLPETKLALGTKWQDAAATSNFKVTGIKGTLLIISNNAVPSAPIANNGLSSWNTTIGLTETSEGTRKGRLSAPDGSAMQINQSTTLKLLHTVQGAPPSDTSWANMAVKLGFWSNALKNGAEYDSVKVFKFLEANDPLYEKDSYYAARKLSLLQTFRGPQLNNNYEKQLLKTPNHLIADEASHLHNKLGDVLSHSADSAYAVAKYLYKSPAFNDWVQHSYAQQFIRPAFTESKKANRKKHLKNRGYGDEEIEEFFRESDAEMINGPKLLELLNNDKDPLMQQKVRAIYLWAKAKEVKNDAAYLLNTANALKKLDDAFIKEGNGFRYNLLVYQLLGNTKETKAAQSLLDHTIKRLEEHTSDTLNKSRYAHQNLLAGAYYMKYLAEKPLDSVKALKYLSKASEYSPKSKKENAHDSFYDRVFLNTKESYRKEFLARLFNTGNKEEALNVFITHLNANPAELKDMVALYEANFPGKDFMEFFSNNILSSWDTAPAFVLKGLKGEDYNLKNYTGKWLVLDFWGTWCGPCRKEMPEINTFNAELKEGKHHGLQFLSIACKDSESNVNSYLNTNKFEIPAAMSDNKVEKTYKITGYPSKIIIAPNGKMLQLNFQHDWRFIATSFAKLMLKE